jgi:hypothetical protein
MNDISITLARIEENISYLPEMKYRLDDFLLKLRFARLKQPLPIPPDAYSPTDRLPCGWLPGTDKRWPMR